MKDVVSMSEELEDNYNKYQKKQWRQQESKQRAKSITTEPKWQKEQKDIVVYAHKSQVVREFKQLERFMKKYPNSADQKILAQVITFKKSLNDHNSSILIASKDTGFFSPYHYDGGKSDIVTEKIFSTFEIRCDHPKEIFQMAGGVI